MVPTGRPCLGFSTWGYKISIKRTNIVEAGCLSAISALSTHHTLGLLDRPLKPHCIHTSVMALTPPPGMDLTEDLGPRIIREVAGCSALVILAFIGRLVSRRMKRAGLSASDYTIALGLLGALTTSGLTIWGVWSDSEKVQTSAS